MKKIFVFDLDFTLWNSGDTFCSETLPPYSWRNNRLEDQLGRWIRLYPDTMRVLEKLSDRDVLLAVASRSHSPQIANQLLHLLDIHNFFHHKEIYPGSKVAHLTSIQQKFKIPFENMYFFDDENRNILDANRLGVNSVHVGDGIAYNQVMRYI